MNRRNFIKNAMLTSSALGLGSTGLLTPLSRAFAADASIPYPKRTLVNTMLLGGADLRQLFVPDPNDPGTDMDQYVAKFWEKRQGIYWNNAANRTNYPTYNDVWEKLYDPVTFNGKTFGISKKANWLKNEFNKGNVAIIPNVYGSLNRRHDHSQLIMHTGDRTTEQFLVDRDGWGGRLAYAMGANSNVVPASENVSMFCKGINAVNRLEQVVHVRDSWNFALAGEVAGLPLSKQSIMARALEGYYQQRGAEIEYEIANAGRKEDWAFRRFFQHERMLRAFGGAFEARMDSTTSSKVNSLRYRINSYRHKYGRQVANLFDSVLANDILDMRIAYLEHASWDSHTSQLTSMDRNLADVFGLYGGLGNLTRALNIISGANENMVHIFTSDFGRQLASNESQGTDHGRGTYTIIVGEAVNGGVYGDMFPTSEIQVDPNDSKGRIRFDIEGSDIEGKTPFERVFAHVCDWLQPGTGSQVFTNLATLPAAEADLRTLFNPGYLVAGNIALAGTGSHLNRVTVTADSNDGLVSVKDTTDGYGNFSIGRLSDGGYTVTPSRPYFSFDPVSSPITVSGDNVSGINYSATASLHFDYVYFKNVHWNDATKDLFITTAYNLVPGQTTIIVGGVAATITNQSTNYLWFTVPVGTMGEIVVTTPTETYTHPHLFEDVVIGAQHK